MLVGLWKARGLQDDVAGQSPVVLSLRSVTVC